MVSRLPITLRPAANEVAMSYLTRLATVHEMPIDELWQQVSGQRRGYGKGRSLQADQFAAVANQPRERLARAIVEFRVPRPDWFALRHEPQRGCRRCNVRHPGGPVIQLLAHHHYVCTAIRSGSAHPTNQTTHNPASPGCLRSSRPNTSTAGECVASDLPPRSTRSSPGS